MAAEELKMEKLEDLKRQVERLGLDEKQRNKLITKEWRRLREAEKQRLAAQAEEHRIAPEAEAEQRRLAA